MSQMYGPTNMQPDIHTKLTFEPGNEALGPAKYIAYYNKLVVQPCNRAFCPFCGGFEEKILPGTEYEVVLTGPIISRKGKLSYIAHRYVPPPDRLLFKDKFITGEASIGSGHGRLVFLGGIGEAGNRVCFLAIHNQSAVMFDCGINVSALEAARPQPVQPPKPEDPLDEWLAFLNLNTPDEEEPKPPLYPDFDRLFELLGTGIKLEAIVVSHGHLDHIGSLPELLRRMQEQGMALPTIYGTAFTNSMIHHHLESVRKEDPTIPEYPLMEDIKAGQELRLGGFQIKPFSVYHSVPDSLGFAFMAEGDTAATLYTGDFKTRWQKHFDVFETANRFKALATDWPIRLLIIDGTNACVPGFSGLEVDVQEGLAEALLSAAGPILVICFSSHIARIKEIFALAGAAKAGHVAIYGQSFKGPLEAASRMGWDPTYHNSLRRARVSIIAGCQANANSVAWRLSQGERIGGFQIDETCTVVESAMPIPGRGPAVAQMLRNFQEQGARVIVDPAFPEKGRIFGCEVMSVHRSGHGFAEDIRTVIKAVQADYVLPFHCSEEAMMEVAIIATLATGIPDNKLLLPKGEGFSIEF